MLLSVTRLITLHVMPTVEFLPSNRKIKVGKYANLKDVARKYGLDIGSGLLEVVEGLENLTPRTLWERTFLSDKAAQFRLAGQVEVLGDVCVITDFKPKPSRQ